MRKTILHMSDVHFGPGTVKQADVKSPMEGADVPDYRPWLSARIRELNVRPDYVVVSGDLTIAGKEGGLADCVALFEELVEQDRLPGMDHFMVVPGNHDVKRSPSGFPLMEAKERWADFRKYFGGRVVLPWFPSLDKTGDEVKQVLLEQLGVSDGNDVGGLIQTFSKKMSKSESWSLPVYWDRTAGILFYLFNSASVSGSRIALDPAAEKSVGHLREVFNRDPHVTAVLDALDKVREVDPARVDPKELDLFRVLMSDLEELGGDAFRRSLKIAVLHHHIGAVFPEEVKQFEGLMNAGRFKKVLADHGFHAVLHGHKHYPVGYLEPAINRKDWSFLTLVGGTIGSYPATGTQGGFHVLTVDTEASTIEVAFVERDPKSDRQAWEPERFDFGDAIGARRATATPAVDATTWKQITGRAAQALSASLRGGANPEDPVGWPHDLEGQHVSVIATAFGLRIMRLLGPYDGPLQKRRKSCIDSLWKLMRNDDGGWSASSQHTDLSWPEATSWVLMALDAWGEHERIDEVWPVFVNMLGEKYDPVLWQQTLSLTLVLEALLAVDRTTPADVALRDRVVEGLRALAVTDAATGKTYWEERKGAGPSVADTARAVSILARLGGSETYVDGGAAWLLAEEWKDASEQITRPPDPKKKGGHNALKASHCTVALATTALLEAGISIHHRRLRAAVAEILGRMKTGVLEYQGKHPIWATLDGLTALRAVVERKPMSA